MNKEQINKIIQDFDLMSQVEQYIALIILRNFCVR